jgi:TonB family protein
LKIRRQGLVALCAASLATGAPAQQVVPSEEYIPAEPVKKAPPDYPTAAVSRLQEGWVQVSFIVSEKGDVIEPMIEQSSNAIFDAPTLRAIRDWRYKPAMLNGKPVEQSMVQTIIRYQLQAATGATPQFIKKYRAVSALIVAKKLDQAGPLVEELEKGELNYYETAWLSWLKYVYLDATGTAQPAVLIDLLNKALGSSGANDQILLPDTFVQASQRLYGLQVRRGDLSEAVAAFKRLEASTRAKHAKVYEDVMAALEPSYREVVNLVGGTKVLQVTGQVNEHNYWVHRMLRRSFAFGDVQGGKLEVVDVRCTRVNRRFVSMPENSVLKIPDTWGDCSLYIKGEEGTTFAFEEYPAGYSAADDSAPAAPTKE